MKLEEPVHSHREYKIEYHNAFWNRGLIKYALKDYKGALDDFLKAKNIRKFAFVNVPKKWARKYAMELARKRHPEEKTYSPIKELLLCIYFDIGDAYYQLGEYEKALEAYEQAIQKGKSAHFSHGNTLFKLGKYQEAIQVYLNCIEKMYECSFDEADADYMNIVGALYGPMRSDYITTRPNYIYHNVKDNKPSSRSIEILKQIYSNLVICYKTLGNTEEANKYKNFTIPKVDWYFAENTDINQISRLDDGYTFT